MADKDGAFVTEVIRSLNWLLSSGLAQANYSSLLRYHLQSIQYELKISQLTEEDRNAFWAPIAGCYARVQAVLTERIKPLTDRTLVKVGDTITVPVEISAVSLSSGIERILIASLPEFAYAIERLRDDEGSPTYRKTLNHVSFNDQYICALPETVKQKLPTRGTINLPLKIVYAAHGGETIVEIDTDEFLKENK